MYKHILIATDGSETGNKAVAQGLELAKNLSAKATIVVVTESWTEAAYNALPSPSLIKAYEKTVAENANQILAAAGKAAQEKGITWTTVHVRDQHPADGIIEAAKEKGCDLIVVGSHGRRGLVRALLGSESLKILTLSTLPVLVCR